MKIIFATLLVLFVMTTTVQAETTRILTCKAPATGEFEDGYRLNVNLNSKGEYKAVLSGGQTTRNSLFTWTVSATESSGKMILVKNLNKSPLNLQVETGIDTYFNKFEGKQSYLVAEFEITPYLAKTKKFKIEGPLVCKVTNLDI